MSQHPTVAVFHDYFAIRGGGERLALTLAEALDAHLYFGYRTPDSYDEEAFPGAAKEIGLALALRAPGVRPVPLAIAFARYRREAERYPIRIFSGVSAPFAAPRRGKGLNIFYCHTPPRFLFDQRSHFAGRMPGITRGIAPAILGMFEREYRRAVSRMDVIVTNSENTKARIRKYLQRDSVVIYPPIETTQFVWSGQGDYYLSTARLSPLKRVDRIIEAFKAMPDKKLVVASGGTELERLKALAENAANIEFRGWVDDKEMISLIGNCIASIYLPRDEDFGMSPVESMAAGKPVIGVAEGGLQETIISGETGSLLPPEFTLDDLVGAIRDLTPTKALSMRAAAEARAQRFSRERFLSEIKKVIDDAGMFTVKH